MADSIEAVQVDGKLYIITANEGDDKEYGDFEEKVKAEDLFSGGVFNGTVPSYDCEASAESNALCMGSLRVTVGSASVDYTNVTWPMIRRIVAFGGRGISIFKVPEDLKLVCCSLCGIRLTSLSKKHVQTSHGHTTVFKMKNFLPYMACCTTQRKMKT